jgi:hypothetical protein
MQRANAPSLERDTQTVTASDVSTTFGEKPSHQASLASLNSLHSADASVANQEGQEKGQHVTEARNEEGADGTTLEPVRSAHPSVKDVSKIPNGGLWAWLQVVGGFFLLFNSWGIINTFGKSYCTNGL